MSKIIILSHNLFSNGGSSSEAMMAVAKADHDSEFQNESMHFTSPPVPLKMTCLGSFRCNKAACNVVISVEDYLLLKDMDDRDSSAQCMYEAPVRI